MANKALFGGNAARRRNVPVADVKNAAGGRAYKRGDEAALAQFAATGMFQNTFHVKAQDQLKEVLEIAQRVDTSFLAKVAVYSRKHAYLKDMPAVLVAVLATRDTALFKQVFPLVIDNGRMLRNFVQVMRSGAVGRRSLGSAPKKAVKAWFDRSSDDYIFRASVGNSPSIADVIKMVHPTPGNSKSRDALYAYLLGKKYDGRSLPKLVRAFEAFKVGTVDQRELPAVPFQLLDSAGLSSTEWKQIARDGRWMFTRMNLNTFQRHGVLEDPEMVKLIADRLGDADQVRAARQYPYQIFTTYKAVADKDMPADIIDGLHAALDASLSNVPKFEGRTAILVDVSGSMSWAINPEQRGMYRSKATVSCREVASLFASAVLRTNRDAVVYAFDNNATRVRLNARDTVFTNAEKIAKLGGGGTNMSAGIQKLMADFKGKDMPDNIVVISDNESWADAYGDGRYSFGYTNGTGSMHEFAKYKGKNRKARLVLIDLTPTADTQVENRDDVLNVGGFSDAVFDVIAGFTKSRGSKDFWEKKIRQEITIS